MPAKINKGKSVDPGERTRLLPPEAPTRSTPTQPLTTQLTRRSDSSVVIEPQPIDHAASRRTNRLITSLIVICSILLGAILFLGLLLSSYIPSSKERDSLPDAVVFNGPTDINVLNITSSGVWLEVEGYAGVDVDRILGIDRDQVSGGERGGGAGWWERLRAEFGRLAVDLVGPVEVGSVQGLEIWSSSASPDPLFSARLPSIIPIPLATHVNSSETDSAVWAIPPWLTAIRIPVHVRPETSTSTLLGLAKKAWKEGSIDVEVHLESVTVRSRHREGWRRYVEHTERDIKVPLTLNSE
jgi:hypothetical protein